MPEALMGGSKRRVYDIEASSLGSLGGRFGKMNRTFCAGRLTIG